MDSPLVSIIIPVYNAERYIADSICSAIKQTWPNKEIIIIDDGSTDNSLSAIKKYENERIKVYSQANKGASAARNFGIKMANGKYIQFLDADDLLSPDKIEAQLNVLNESEDYLALCATVNFLNNESLALKNVEHYWYGEDNDDPFDFLIKLYSSNEIMAGLGGFIQPNAWLTPAKLIKKAGPWNEELTVDDDGEYFCRILLASKGIRYDYKGINYYRNFSEDKNLSAQKSKEAHESACRSTDLKYSHLKKFRAHALLDQIFARHYRLQGIAAFPVNRNLSEYCIQKSKDLGYKATNYPGGPKSQWVNKYLGWRTARLFSYLRNGF